MKATGSGTRSWRTYSARDPDPATTGAGQADNDERSSGIAAGAANLARDAVWSLDPGGSLARLALTELRASGRVTGTLAGVEEQSETAGADVAPLVDTILGTALNADEEPDQPHIHQTLREIEQRRDVLLTAPRQVVAALDAVCRRAATAGGWLGASTEILLARVLRRAGPLLAPAAEHRFHRAVACADVVTAARIYAATTVEDASACGPIETTLSGTRDGTDQVASARYADITDLASELVTGAASARGEDDERAARVRLHGAAVGACLARGRPAEALAAVERVRRDAGVGRAFGEAVTTFALGSGETGRALLAAYDGVDAASAEEADDGTRGRIAAALLKTEAATTIPDRAIDWLHECTNTETRLFAITRAVAATAAEDHTGEPLDRLLHVLAEHVIEDGANAPAKTAGRTWEVVMRTLDDHGVDIEAGPAARRAIGDALRAIAPEDEPAAIAKAYLEIGFTGEDANEAWNELAGRLLASCDEPTLTEIGIALETTAVGTTLARSLGRGALRPDPTAGPRSDPLDARIDALASDPTPAANGKDDQTKDANQ